MSLRKRIKYSANIVELRAIAFELLAIYEAARVTRHENEHLRKLCDKMHERQFDEPE